MLYIIFLEKDFLLSTTFTDNNLGLKVINIRNSACALFSILLILLSNHVFAAQIQLNDDESRWLSAHPTIRLAVDIDWPPFEYIDAHNNYVGMASEYIGLVGDKLGIHFEVEKEKPWADVVEAVKNGELDMYSCVVSTPQRREYASFTRPYLSFPMVIVTSDKVAYVDSLKDLKNETVAVVKGYATHDLLVKNHPELKLHLAENLSDALEAVSLGKVYAYIGNIASVSEMLKRKGLTNLKISGKTPYKYELSMAVRKDWAEFTPILQKALDSITEQEHDQIYQNWIKLRYEHGIDYSLLWKTLAAVLLVIITILIWNRRLSAEIHRRIEVQRLLNDEHQRLELSLHGGDLGAWDWDLLTGVVQVNELWLTMLGYPADNLELDYKFWEGLIHPDDLTDTLDQIDQVISGHLDFYDAEFRLKGANGDYQWIRSRGQIVAFSRSRDPIRMAGVQQDIDALKKVQDQLVSINNQMMNYVEIVNKYVITSSTDKGGIINYTSKAFCDISGYNSEELIGNNHRIVRHPDMPAELYQDLWGSISQGKTWQGEIKNRKKNGDCYWVQAFISPNFDDRGNIQGYTAIRQDISDKKRIEKLSITDELTSLYNRRYFNELFPQELSRAERDKKILAMMILDVDYFKLYNDNYGHQQGDIALISIAKVLQESLRRAGDFAFRIGGEEFGGIISVDTIEDARLLAERVRTAVEGLNILHEHNQVSDFVTVSIGMKIHHCNGEFNLDMDTFFRLADNALYQAKENGRNRVEIDNDSQVLKFSA